MTKSMGSHSEEVVHSHHSQHIVGLGLCVEFVLSWCVAFLLVLRFPVTVRKHAFEAN